jgi:HEAT repeat protein
MSKNDPIESALDAIGSLRNEASPQRAARELRSYLGNRSNLVLAKAAKIAGELQVSQMVPELVKAFDRLMKDPSKLDKRCAALTEIAAALYELDYVEPDLYRRGLRHVQMEASFGPPVDAAAALRGMSAQALLRSRYPKRMEEVLPLLVDPEPAARLGAVRAMATNGGDAGLLLLRLKVLTDDEDSDVLGECFSALLAADPEQSLSFVAAYLDDEKATTAEAAIWALGQSRLPAAFGALREKWERTLDHSVRKIMLSAIAASRLPEALDFLYAQLRQANLQTAQDVVETLAPYGASETITEAVRSAVEERGHKSLLESFALQFRR